MSTTTEIEVRVEYSYGINSITRTGSVATMGDVPAVLTYLESEARRVSRGPVQVERIETRSVTRTVTPWVNQQFNRKTGEMDS